MTREASQALPAERKRAIIEAAKECFSKSGFHGASMADLSQHSGLGAGQIYRYFENKESLINEVVKNIATEWCEFLLEHLEAQDDFLKMLNTKSDFWSDWTARDQCLLLETYSESSRNPQIRTILSREENKLKKKLQDMYLKKTPDWDSEVIKKRIDILLILVDGFVCRTFHDAEMNKNELKAIGQLFSQHLFDLKA